MHIMTSFYNAMTRVSDAFINAMPGRGSYTLHHKIRVVTNTPNGPGKKTTQWQPRMKSPPAEPVQLTKYRIISEEFPAVPQRPDQTSTGARRDLLFSQSERKIVVDILVANIREHRKQKAEKQKAEASEAASATTSASVSRQIAVAEPPEPTIGRQDAIPPWKKESEWSALAPVPKTYSGKIAQPEATQGKSRDKRIAPQASALWQNEAGAPARSAATTAPLVSGIVSGRTAFARIEKAKTIQSSSAPIIVACHPKQVAVPAETGPGMSRQVLSGKLKIVLGTRAVKEPQLMVRSSSDPGSDPDAIITPTILRDARRSLKSAKERCLAPMPEQKPHELECVFSRRRAKEALVSQSIAGIERGSARPLPQYVTDDGMINVSAYMRDCNKRLMAGRNDEGLI